MKALTIYDLVSEFQRLDPEGADGYVGHEGNNQEWPTVGWSDDHAVVSVHPADISEFVRTLRRFRQGIANMSGILSLSYQPQKATQHLRCKWHI